VKEDAGCSDAATGHTAAQAIVADTQIVAVVGTPHFDRDLYNAAAVCAGGEVKAFVQKRFLPNYGVFDEHRWFRSGTTPVIIEVGGVACGITICEDLWVDAGPVHEEALAGAHVIVNLSASPWRLGRGVDREQLLEAHATRSTVAIALCNQVGGQDELAFDGRSLVVDHTGRLIARGAHGSEQLVLCDINAGAVAHQREVEPDHIPEISLDERSPARPITRFNLDELVAVWTPPTHPITGRANDRCHQHRCHRHPQQHSRAGP